MLEAMRFSALLRTLAATLLIAAPTLAQSPAAAKGAGSKPTAPATPQNTSPRPGGVRKPAPAARAGTVTPLISPRPVVTGQPNTNLLSFTDAMAGWWELTNMLSAADKQADETGGRTASRFVPSATDAAHAVTWNPQILTDAAPRNYTLTVFAKADGANHFFDIGVHTQTGERGLGVEQWFDLAACSASGGPRGFRVEAAAVTASAAAAAGGFCRLKMSFTVAADTFLDQVFFGAAPSAGSLRFAGDGVAAVVVSHPQLAVGAVDEPYQAVAGVHTYCVAAYFHGETPGCSTATDVPSEVNTIAVPAVKGADFCRVFRGGAMTDGALTVRGRSAVACGSTIVDDHLAADGSAAPVAVTPYDSRPTRSAITEYKVCNAGYACRLFTAGPGVSGTIDSLHISVGNANPDEMKLAIRCDGAEKPEIVDAGTFFLSQDYPASSFLVDRIGIGNPSRTAFSANRATEINFTNGCTVDLATPTRQTLFADVIYRLGRRLSKPSRAVWHARLTPMTMAPALHGVDLLPEVTSEGGGELESVTLFASPTVAPANFRYLEGNPTVITDGDMAVTSNGTEDFFGSGWYFADGRASQQTNKWGFFAGSALSQKETPADVLAYRFFGDAEPVFFERTLRMTWKPGQAAEGATDVKYKALVTWWTAR